MKPFDDPLPEEQEQPYSDLIALIQQARRPAISAEADECAAALARVEQRLTGAATTDTQTEATEVSPGTLLSFGPRARRRATARVRWRAFSTLAAVLVVALLISSSLLLFHRAPAAGTGSAATGAAPVGTPVNTQIASNGLGMTMSVTPGPYFLGEMIQVDMIITNQRANLQELLVGGVPPRIAFSISTLL